MEINHREIRTHPGHSPDLGFLGGSAQGDRRRTDEGSYCSSIIYAGIFDFKGVVTVFS
jgi:hypothetical protein